MLDIAETPELTGHLIWALFNDSTLMDKSGQTWIGAELARRVRHRRTTAAASPRRTVTCTEFTRSGSSTAS